MIKINRYDKLSEFKNKLQEKFWLESQKIKLLSKGKFLKGEDKSLLELGFEDKQTIMILEKNIKEEEKYEIMKEKENLEYIKNIFENFDKDFLVFVLRLKDNNLDETILYLSDNKNLKDLKKRFRDKGEFEDKVFFTEKNIKFLIMSKLSSEDFFSLLFKLEKIDNNEIHFMVWQLIKCLPPNYSLIQNIKKEIRNLKKIKLESILGNIKNNENKILEEKYVLDECFDFNITEIFKKQSAMEIYKLNVFHNLISIFNNNEEEIKTEKKFKLQKEFIKNNGINFFSKILTCLIEKLEINKNKINVFEIKAASLIASFLKGYLLSHFLSKHSDPIKKSKQIFNKKWLKNYKKEEVSEISLKKNNSTDNIFFENQNISFKTNKSPKSISRSIINTPNFQSPNVSRSISAYSLPKLNGDKDDISFSVFTNTSKESNRVDNFNSFLKKIFKDKDILEELEINFENCFFLDKVFGFLIFHLENLKSDFEDTTEVLFDLILKIVYIDEKIIGNFKADFFWLLFKRIDDYLFTNNNFNDKLFKFFCEILYSENIIGDLDEDLFNDLLDRLLKTIFEEKFKSYNIFLVFNKIFSIYYKKKNLV